MPTHTTTTPLHHFCAPVIHPITGESITNYTSWQNVQQQGKSELQHLERNGETLRKDITKQELKVKLTICSRSQQNQTDTYQQHSSHICKYCYRLQPTKEIPQPHQDCHRRQPHRLPGRTHNKNGRSHNIKNIM